VTTSQAPVAGRELRTLGSIQQLVAGRPGMLATARGLSHFGEHSLGWVGVAVIGAALDSPRRGQWGSVALGAVGAHAASIVLKRVVRRPRPDHPSVRIGVSTPSKLSFPSSHAASTAAAAVLLGKLTGWPLPALLIPPMVLSRMVLGVHYPTDVLAGATLGAGAATALLLAQDKYGLPGGPMSERSDVGLHR